MKKTFRTEVIFGSIRGYVGGGVVLHAHAQLVQGFPHWRVAAMALCLAISADDSIFVEGRTIFLHLFAQARSWGELNVSSLPFTS